MAYLFGFFFGRTPLIKVSGAYLIRRLELSKLMMKRWNLITLKTSVFLLDPSNFIPFSPSDAPAALPKEDLGGFYWRFLLHGGVRLPGEDASFCIDLLFGSCDLD